MLHFLRRYQKLFFAMVAVVVIVSFTLVGAYNRTTPFTIATDPQIGVDIYGNPFSQRQLDTLVRILSTRFESGMSDTDNGLNLLNDGVIQKDFLRTGLGVQLVKQNFSLFQKELQERIDQARRFTPYVHPQTPLLSAEAIWQRCIPNLQTHRDRLSAIDTVTPDTVEVLTTLYFDQCHFPSHLLRAILCQQQQQFSWLIPDPYLETGDLSLFGFHSLEDWLGSQFIKQICLTILQGAALAEEKGYVVSLAEAKEALVHNIRLHSQQLARQKPQGQQIENIYRAQVQAFGQDERLVLQMWRKVMLFRRLLDDVGGAVLIDDSLYQPFATFASESIVADAYSLPAALRIETLIDLFKLQVYIDAVSSPAIHSTLDLPHSSLSPEEVQEAFPELTEHRFSIALKEVHKDLLAERVALRDAYEWELDEAHWEIVCTHIPEMRKLPASTREARFVALEGADESARRKIDRIAKYAIVDQHPDWLNDAMRVVESKTMNFGCRSSGGHVPFASAPNQEDLLHVLASAPLLEGEQEDTYVAYSPDPLHYYRIALLAPPGTLSIVTYADVAQDGTLDRLLDRRLAEAYPGIRKKHSKDFQDDAQNWKPLEQVRTTLGTYVFADLLSAIAREAECFTMQTPTEDNLDLYAKYRMFLHLHKVCRVIQGAGDDHQWVASDTTQGFGTQWRLLRTERRFGHKEARAIDIPDLFAYPPDTWSPIVSLPDQGAGVLHIHYKDPGQKKSAHDLLTQGRELFANDAKRMVMKELFARIAGAS